MKKNLLLSFLILFVLSTALLAGVTDPKKETDKVSAKNTKENKLSDEEISRLNRKTDGKYTLDVSKMDNSSLRKNSNANQIIVEEGHHHHYYWYGGFGFILVVILIIVLV
jgi:hypothetical protein